MPDPILHESRLTHTLAALDAMADLPRTTSVTPNTVADLVGHSLEDYGNPAPPQTVALAVAKVFHGESQPNDQDLIAPPMTAEEIEDIARGACVDEPSKRKGRERLIGLGVGLILGIAGLAQLHSNRVAADHQGQLTMVENNLTKITQDWSEMAQMPPSLRMSSTPIDEKMLGDLGKSGVTLTQSDHLLSWTLPSELSEACGSVIRHTATNSLPKGSTLVVNGQSYPAKADAIMSAASFCIRMDNQPTSVNVYVPSSP